MIKEQGFGLGDNKEFKYEVLEAIETAMELGYPKSTLRKLKSAKNRTQINNILAEARHSDIRVNPFDYGIYPSSGITSLSLEFFVKQLGEEELADETETECKTDDHKNEKCR